MTGGVTLAPPRAAAGRIALVLLLFLCTGGAAVAHPHMLLEARLTLEYEGRECTGLWTEWGFDSVFSASIIQGFDRNKDGQFSAQETQAVRENAFSNLRNYGYFVFLRKGTARRNPRAVDNFSVWQEKGKLFYRFHVPLAGEGYGEEFSVSIFDPSYFCVVRYAKDPVTFEQGGSGDLPRQKLVTNTRYPIYYNPAGTANDLRTYEKWEPGLEKAYPEEIHVSFE